MKPPNQFLPLLKQMLGFYRYGPLALLGWLALSTTCLVLSGIFMLMQQPSATPDFLCALFVWCCLLWFFLTLVATPLPFQMLGGLVSLEFLFTRALDRARWLRTERLAVIVIALGPLFLNLLLSPLSPRLMFDRAEPGTPAAAVLERYQAIFPGSQVVAADPSGSPEQIVIAHGTEMFAFWLLWIGAVILFLVAAYWSVVFRQWQRGGWHHSKSRWRPWLGMLMIHTPIGAPVFLVFLCAAWRFNPCEQCYLYFAQHPLACCLALVALILGVQWLTERNIRKLEFEFT
jgi:hypothetical protein